MSNVQRLTGYIGKTGLLSLSGHDGIRFGVTVLDARYVYSKLQLFCEPLAGHGGKWFSADSVLMDNLAGKSTKCVNCGHYNLTDDRGIATCEVCNRKTAGK